MIMKRNNKNNNVNAFALGIAVWQEVEVSQLMYGLSDNPPDPESIIYYPYNALLPNIEGSNMQYPISFHNPRIKSGCVCYDVKSGNCKNGMKYHSFKE